MSESSLNFEKDNKNNLEIKYNSTETFDFLIDKQKYILKLSYNNDILAFDIIEKDSIPLMEFSLYQNYEELKQINKYFINFENLEEIFSSLKRLISDNNLELIKGEKEIIIKIKNILTNNYFLINIPIKEKNINKKIDILLNYITTLNEKVNDLENQIKDIKNENNILKNKLEASENKNKEIEKNYFEKFEILQNQINKLNKKYENNQNNISQNKKNNYINSIDLENYKNWNLTPYKKNYYLNPMKELCDSLIKKGYITNNKVYDAMMQVDRADFAPRSPYEDKPQSIDYNVTISAPHMHAYCLELLKNHLKEGGRALDIGFGSGYLTVAMSKMMGDKGTTVGIEHIEELCEFAKKNISKNHKNLLDEKKIILIQGDGRLGYKKLGPYNCIHVGAAASELPQPLIDQLAFGGRLVIPVGNQITGQYIYIYDKDRNGKISRKRELGVRYVPLTSVREQLRGY